MNEPQTEDSKTKRQIALENLKEHRKIYQDCIDQTNREIQFLESNPDLDMDLLRKIILHAANP